MEPMKLEPGKTWGECVCPDIDTSDRPCIVCECRFGTTEAKRRLAALASHQRPARVATKPVVARRR